MLPFLAEENFDGRVLDGLPRRLPDLDALRVQESGLGSPTEDVLVARAAERKRVVLSHDVKAPTDSAMRRVEAGLGMPGLVEVSRKLPIRLAIDDLVLLAA